MRPFISPWRKFDSFPSRIHPWIFFSTESTFSCTTIFFPLFQSFIPNETGCEHLNYLVSRTVRVLYGVVSDPSSDAAGASLFHPSVPSHLIFPSFESLSAFVMTGFPGKCTTFFHQCNLSVLLLLAHGTLPSIFVGTYFFLLCRADFHRQNSNYAVLVLGIVPNEHVSFILTVMLPYLR